MSTNNQFLLVFVIITFFTCFCNSAELFFNVTTTINCPLSPSEPPTFNFSLTVPSTWPEDTPAQYFLLHGIGNARPTDMMGFAEPNMPGIYASTSIDVNSTNYMWTTSLDSDHTQQEVWIPQQPSSTIIFVQVVCGGTVSFTFTLEPVIPAGIPVTNQAGFLASSVFSLPGGIHSTWFAYNSTAGSNILRSELCAPLGAAGALLTARIVFPNAQTTTICDPHNIVGNTNCVLQSSLSITFATSAVGVLYVWVYLQAPTFQPTPYSFDILASNSDGGALYRNMYITPTTNYVTLLRVNNDLFIMSPTPAASVPTDVSLLKVFYSTDSSDPNKMFFQSGCFLKAHSAKYLYTGSIVNSNTDHQLALSDMDGVKLEGFFSKVEYHNNIIMGLLIGDYVAVPLLHGIASLNVDSYNESGKYIAAIAAVSAFAGVCVIVLIVGYVMYKKRVNYSAVH